MPREYVIYTDESVKTGPFFGNFYGGVLLRSSDVDHVNATLRVAATRAGFDGEVKWQKVTSQYLDRYSALMGTFFDLIRDRRLKVRIMFTQTRNVAVDLQAYHRNHAYHLLYFQFLKHAFGLRYCNPGGRPIRLRLYMDQLPDTADKNALLIAFLAGLADSVEFKESQILVPRDQIAEVDSRKHIVLQCLDVVLGAMQFRLNDLHKAKPTGSRRRAKRTVAKHALYRFISRRIREIQPGFNIGVSTAAPTLVDRFKQPYRHWLFVPSSVRIDASRTKVKKK
jgi:hypothetical protein